MWLRMIFFPFMVYEYILLHKLFLVVLEPLEKETHS